MSKNVNNDISKDSPIEFHLTRVYWINMVVRVSEFWEGLLLVVTHLSPRMSSTLKVKLGRMGVGVITGTPETPSLLLRPSPPYLFAVNKTNNSVYDGLQPFAFPHPPTRFPFILANALLNSLLQKQNSAATWILSSSGISISKWTFERQHGDRLRSLNQKLWKSIQYNIQGMFITIANTEEDKACSDTHKALSKLRDLVFNL